MLSVLATRYARALVDVVATQASGIDPSEVLVQLRSIEQVLADSVDLRNAFLSPAVSPSRKRAIAQNILGPLGLFKQVLNFLFVILDHRRVHEFSSIVDAFEVLLDERLGYVRADVSSARDMTDAQKAALEAEISRVAQKKAKLKFSTDPTLVGGVMARIGSTVYDGSVRGQLDRLRTKLARA